MKFLQQNLDYLREAEGHLEWSWQKCQKINLDDALSNEAQELYKEIFKSIDPLREIIRKSREYISAKFQ